MPRQAVSAHMLPDESKVDWQMLKEKWGIDRNALEASGDLREMLYNRKSKLVNVTPTFGGEKFNIEARLSFRTDPDGSVKLVPHFIQSEQKIDQFMGYKFSKIDQANLKENGNLGRIVELTDPAPVRKSPRSSAATATPTNCWQSRQRMSESVILSVRPN